MSDDWDDEKEVEFFGDGCWYFKEKKKEVINGGIYIENNKKTQLRNTYPSWEDKRFDEPKIIFLDDEKYHPKSKNKPNGYGFDYSDRISEWDYRKSQESWDKAAKHETNINTAEFYERYLQHYFDNEKLELHCILVGVNLSNGYPYLVFGYINRK